MNIQDQPALRLMNTIFRSRGLRKVASWLIHPDLFLRFGKWWSGKSRKSHGEVQSARVLNPLIDYAIEYGKEHKIDYYIFGHLHFAADIAGAEHILFLGDWHTQPSYISLDNNGEIKLVYINS
jgi:UDP-2,3-diacylglucosamine hydrolase